MDKKVLAPLNSLEESLNTLVSSLLTTNTFTGATAAAQSILAADDALTEALVLLKRHQDNYARILRLRTEAERLHEQLRDIVRACNDLRFEASQIHPSILQDNGDEEEEQQLRQPGDTYTQKVDYNMLLGFAARIGKHNASAAREAEQESARRRAEAIKKKSGQINGNISLVELSDEPGGQNATQESQAALAAISEAMALQRAAVGMAFPPPDRLRMGLLGQLQWIREQEGDDAVEREAMKLVQDSEDVVKHTESSVQPEVDSSSQERMQYQQPEQASQRSKPLAPPKEQKKINLDFDEFNSDEDD